MTQSMLSTAGSTGAAVNGAARSLHTQLLCTQLTPMPPPSSHDILSKPTATLPYKTTKKRKSIDESNTKKVITTTDSSPTTSPYPTRSRLRRTTSNTPTPSTPTSPSSPLSPLTPLSSSRSELHASLVQSFPASRYCAFPLSLYHDPSKGYGVRSTTAIPRHSLICEYAGDLLSSHSARSREAVYALDAEAGCYMFYFAYNAAEYCVDSTRVPADDALPHNLTLGYGRYINHSRHTANLYGRVIGVSGRPHLCFFAKRVIGVDEELLIDYGDRSRESRQAFPWLNS